MKKLYVNYQVPNSLVKFLKGFFNYKYGYRDYFSTITTYKDRECNIIDFKPFRDNGHYRTFDVLLRLANTYYGKVSPTKLLRACKKVSLKLVNCGDVKNITLYKRLNFTKIDIRFDSSFKSKLTGLNLKDMKELLPRYFTK